MSNPPPDPAYPPKFDPPLGWHYVLCSPPGQLYGWHLRANDE